MKTLIPLFVLALLMVSGFIWLVLDPPKPSPPPPHIVCGDRANPWCVR